MARRGEAVKMVPVDEDDGDLMTIEEFREEVRLHNLIDYDGEGSWATATEWDFNSRVTPSGFKCGTDVPPEWATHVFWFNR